MMRKQPLIGFGAVAILLALCAIGIAFSLASITPEDFPKEPPLAVKIFGLVFSVFIATVSLFFATLFGEAKNCGINWASENDLLPDEIYELVTGGFSGVKFFCYLRLRNGEVRAFQLDREVPPVFKTIKDKQKPGEYLYQAYPLTEQVT